MPATAFLQPTPADLETRLAALRIPVARLIAAAGISRSTWSDWHAGRTRPRPDRWAATTAAFDALVFEAPPLPGDAAPDAAGADPVTLTGSSVPTGAPPSFAPIVTAPAAEARPTGLAAPPTSFKADLSMLAALTAESDQLSRLECECYERTSWPGAPEALFCRPADGLFFLGVAARRHDGRSWYSVSAVERLRTETFDGAFVDPSGRDRRRRDEIVAAYDAWQADRAAASEASGLAALEAENQACTKLMRELRDILLGRPVRSLDDVLAKAAVFGWWYIDEGENAAATIAADRARMLAAGEGTQPLAMALGILGDLVTMAEARGLTIACPAEQAGAAAPDAPIAAAAA